MLILVRKQNRKPVIRLVKVGQTDSGRTWIFTFVDPVHKLMQSTILMKELPDAGLAMEAFWDTLWERWTQAIKEREWRQPHLTN